MKPLSCFAVSAAAALFGLTGCEAPANLPRAAAQRDKTQADAWVLRRQNQLKQMGLKDGEAALKAREEWEHLGNSTESYTIYDSSAKQQAKQEKFEEDLAKSTKSN